MLNQVDYREAAEKYLKANELLEFIDSDDLEEFILVALFCFDRN